MLRGAMAVDSLDKCGIYFGSTGGQVYCSADAGDSWNPIVRRFSGVAFGGGADDRVSEHAGVRRSAM